MLGLDTAAGGDEVFRQFVLARIIRPASKQNSLRVLEEVGVVSAPTPRLSVVVVGNPPQGRCVLATVALASQP